MSLSSPQVVVVGGGPGGLTLAGVLQRGGVAVTVLERDPSPDTRVRGGPLDLHADSGQIAIRAVGLYDEWLALSRPEDQAMTMLDRHAEVVLEMPADPGDTSNPEIDRTQLRDLVRDALAPGTVRYDAAVTDVVMRPDGRPEVECHDGQTLVADLVVGADGAWSRVRPLLSAATPTYSGVTFVEFTITDVDRRHPDLAATLGRGTTMAHGADRGLGAQRLDGGDVWAHAALRVPDRWADDAGFPHDDPGQARALLRAQYPGWSPRLLALLDVAVGPFVVRRIRVLPVRHIWLHRPGITLLGDAAHLMSPFGGQGANLAMLDAADLGAAVVTAATGDGDLAGAVAGYEQGMWPRASEAAYAAQVGLERAIAADAPAGVLAYFEALSQGAGLRGATAA